MKTLFFDTEKFRVYSAIKWASENAELQETRFVCNMILAHGSPSAIGYTVQVNEYYLEHLVYAMAEYSTNCLQHK